MLEPRTGDLCDWFFGCPCDGPSEDAGQRALQAERCCPKIPRAEWLPGSPMVPAAPSPLTTEGDCCPAAMGASPEAHEALRARSWWERGQLAQLYPQGIPAVVEEAVDAAESARAAWLAEARRLDDEARKGR